MIDQWLGQILTGRASAQAGMTQMAAQINATEKVGAATAARASAARGTFPSNGPKIASVPAGI